MKFNVIGLFALLALCFFTSSNIVFAKLDDNDLSNIEKGKIDFNSFEKINNQDTNISNKYNKEIFENLNDVKDSNMKSLLLTSQVALSKFENNSLKIKDDSSNSKKRNKLSDVVDGEIDKIAGEKIGLEEVSSPILKFILQKVKPFIEVRIDSMLIKAGFDSHLKEVTDQESSLSIKIIEASPSSNSGHKLVCGQEAEISFSVEDEYGGIINDDYKDARKWMIIGGNELPKGMELGMIGMQIGETREITSPSNLNAGPTDLAIKLFISKKPSVFRVILHDFKDDEMRNEIRNNLKFFDVLGSISRQLSCVDFIQVDFRILDASGNILYKSPVNQPLKFIIGSGSNPYFEEILIGAKNYGKRIAFVETKYLQDLKRVPYLKGIGSILDSNKGVVLELSPSLASNSH